MRYMIVTAEAVTGNPPSNELASSIVTVLLTLLAVALPVGLLVGLLVLAGRVRRYGERLAQEEARLAAAEGRQPVGQ